MRTTLPKSGKSKTRVEVERYPMPETTEGLCKLVQALFEKGGIKRFEIDGLVRVTRESEIDPDMTEPNKSWEEALQGLENFIEFNPKNSTDPAMVLLYLTNLIERKGLKPVCFAAGPDTGLLSLWLGLGELEIGLEALFGIPVRRMNSLPEETIILCGAPIRDADPTEIEFAVKTTIEVRTKNEERKLPSSETASTGRGDTGEYSQTTGPLAAATGGLRKVSWKSSSFPRT
jgi:hypothetical protein